MNAIIIGDTSAMIFCCCACCSSIAGLEKRTLKYIDTTYSASSR